MPQSLSIELVPSIAAAPTPGKPIDIHSLKVEEYFRARSLAQNTEKSYRRSINRFRAWCDLPWGSVNTRIAGQYKAHLIEQRYKPSTINLYLAPLNDLYRWMAKAYPEQTWVNPWAAIEYLDVPEPLPQDLSEEHVKALWDVLADRPLRDRLLFALLSHGLRQSEVIGLRFGDYDGEKITITKAKADSTGLVWLTPGACALIERAMDEKVDDDPIVWSEKRGRIGKPLSAIGMQSIVRAIGELAGIPNLNPHRFRHATAVKMLREGLTPEQVATVLRHKSIQSTRRYTAAIRQESAGQAFLAKVGEVVASA